MSSARHAVTGPRRLARQAIGCYLLLFAVSLAAYFNALNTFFIPDDFGIVDAIAQNGFNIYPNFVRYTAALTWLLDFSIWGYDAFGYHLTNVAIHAAAAAAVFGVVLVLGDEARRPHTAWAAGLIFALLPSHSEAVV